MGSLYLVLCVCFLLVVNTSASDCLERLVHEMICYVSRGTLNSTHSLTHSLTRNMLLKPGVTQRSFRPSDVPTQQVFFSQKEKLQKCTFSLGQDRVQPILKMLCCKH